jgi:hypothetical protein
VKRIVFFALAAALMLVVVAPAAAAPKAPECWNGCTRTIGYWRTHPDEFARLLPKRLGTYSGARSVNVTTIEMGVAILSMNWNGGDPSNGITKLYAQELAAKFNIALRADPRAIQGTINSADYFLATHNQADWANLSDTERAQVLAWAQRIDDYNSGVIGPGHCPGVDDVGAADDY